MTAFRELAQHILDIFENGVKARATRIQLGIEEDLRADVLRFSISDNGCGMDAAMVQHITDPWVTTRTTRKVGLGIPFLKQTAEMCEGDFAIESEVGRGTTTRASFRHSHIDRPPLGNLADTLLCMIVGYPQVNLIYTHRVQLQTGELREFMLDTAEIRDVLGDDLELSAPEVIGFLKDLLAEGLATTTLP